MVLVDTSVWVQHLREGITNLAVLLDNARVACHPFIIGELACGSIENRSEVLGLLQVLPSVQILELEEYFYFIEQNSLIGKGIGFVDIHLLASAKMTVTPLWSLDKHLMTIADSLGLLYKL